MIIFRKWDTAQLHRITDLSVSTILTVDTDSGTDTLTFAVAAA